MIDFNFPASLLLWLIIVVTTLFLKLYSKERYNKLEEIKKKMLMYLDTNTCIGFSMFFFFTMI